MTQPAKRIQMADDRRAGDRRIACDYRDRDRDGDGDRSLDPTALQ